MLSEPSLCLSFFSVFSVFLSVFGPPATRAEGRGYAVVSAVVLVAAFFRALRIFLTVAW
jgi:hypothetical protein